MIYLDNAASTWPKPSEVAEATKAAIVDFGANPGRGGHRLARKAEQTIAETRAKLARLFGVRDPDRFLFCFHTTHATNLAIQGILSTGDHVIISGWEHNAVARPVTWLAQARGVEVSVVEPPESGESGDWLAVIKAAVTNRTKLLITIHGSNVTGEVLPIVDIGHFARERGITYMVDAAQTAGLLPFQLDEWPVDLVAFPGHKGLYGPQGTGGLYVAAGVSLRPLLFGGTGSRSEEVEQPMDWPGGFESGTPNTPGIAGLGAGLDFVLNTGIDQIYQHEMELARLLWEGLKAQEGVRLATEEMPPLPLFSFNLVGLDGQEVAMILDQHYDIAVRAGYHCAALKHRSLGTEAGAIRVSPGYFNTSSEMDAFLRAIAEIRQYLL
ncbi:aminotransferase class V-fold PLP-dependent enzyme [Laceyella putida]|uniref:cysteine desulfurase n=1 Tax=Laceyella putida TaxID=110101 RepID=A0ABW2RGT3_9BACL